MLNTNKIYLGDCLEIMQSIESSSVDLILCDPPYGIINNLKTDGYKKRNEKEINCTSWDVKINTSKLFHEYERILRRKGTVILFSQEPYTSELRTSYSLNLDFAYPMIWKKNHFGNPLISKIAPLSYFEDISVFYKKYDSELINPTRNYFKEIFNYIGLTKREIYEIFGNQKADHCFRFNSTQFEIPSAEVYNNLIKHFHIDKYENFLCYDKILKMNSKDKTFNIPNGNKYISNILEFDKDTSRFHPTQKPLALCEYLVNIYSNEGDLVLDNCCGSGTTCLAAKNLGRNYIGIEKDENYFKIAMERLNNA